MPARDKPDHYAIRAKREGYPARSVYKLEEIQSKYGIIRRGDRILDIGAAPGSWSIFAGRIVKGGGLVIGVDLQPIGISVPGSHVRFIQGDAFDPVVIGEITASSPFDVILSDAAPSTTGNRIVDTGRSLDIAEQVLGLADSLLKAGGGMVIKVFQGGGERDLMDTLKARFESAGFFKPKASRNQSFETFAVASGFRGPCRDSR